MHAFGALSRFFDEVATVQQNQVVGKSTKSSLEPFWRPCCSLFVGHMDIISFFQKDITGARWWAWMKPGYSCAIILREHQFWRLS